MLSALLSYLVLSSRAKAAFANSIAYIRLILIIVNCFSLPNIHFLLFLRFCRFI
ncbi:hypothetical protein NBRC111894_2950 [Sporolactobacillus inulinus]|uniref:Uncharacterized protein n=1 Tax=Sporolactobacillus inulinus TaxID=2078 RepID=A0A4Y1ZE22_9BACL|nr:hypothetical protein NBRC111894_2950 [Sporolactobacillus inulinus]